MGTTSSRIAAIVLDALIAVDVRFAVLHGEDAIADGRCSSDIDVAMQDPVSRAMRAATPILHEHDLHVVTMWEYDISSTSVFIVDGDGVDGAQIDVVHDRRGLGRYGVRADVIVDAARPGERWPTASVPHELLYLLRKRARKRQVDRLDHLRASTRHVQQRTLEREARRMFADQTAELVIKILNGSDRHGRHIGILARALPEARRLGVRMMRPSGFWLALSGPTAATQAAAVSDRLEPVLPLVRTDPIGSHPLHRATTSGAVEITRRRAGLHCTWTTSRHPGHPDLRVDTSRWDIETTRRMLVLAMEANVRL